tara:strand:+ start:2327 stop:3283 length:957 start_codon:yes stop_codon:yes gene_type:complete
MYPKYYIGPMSKNVVDAILEFSFETGHKIGFIPSRRQVEYSGGYVNNWTTVEFAEHVKGKALIKRDHSGPGQGYTDDDGYESLKYDCENLDMIHIDPWKQYPAYEEGLQWTVDMIKFCHKQNPDIEFEVGTEESIRKFETQEIDTLLTDLKLYLTQQEYRQIKYIVIQSGTSLKGNSNTGDYDRDRLLLMINVAKKHSLLCKEHNGDYIPTNLIKEKFNLGLDAINIAPEFGLIETQSYLDSAIDIDKFYNICNDSMRWRKWVSSDFIPENNKKELIRICGHYVLSNPKFLEIKPNIDREIKNNIKNKLYELIKDIEI